MVTNRDEETIRILMLRIQSYAASRIGSDLAQDAVQETLIILNRAKYDSVQDITELTKLSIAIAARKVKELSRRYRSIGPSIDGGEIEPHDSTPSAYDALLLTQLKDQIKDAIPLLSEECRQIFKLKLQGKTYDEIAKILGKSGRPALYVQCMRCHQRLRNLIRKKEEAR